MKKLDELIEWFNSDDFLLEEATAKYEEAAKLAGEIEAQLASFKNDVTVLKKRFDED